MAFHSNTPLVTVTDEIATDENSGAMRGIVKFVGKIQGKSSVFFGVELSSGEGRNCGKVSDVQYFPCDQENTGIFLKRRKIVTVTPSDESIPRVTVGSRVNLPDKGDGTVSYIGYPQFHSGLWYGIVLDEPNGRNNGTLDGHFYFEAQDGYGCFVSLSKMRDALGLEPEKRNSRGSGKHRRPPNSLELDVHLSPAHRELRGWLHRAKVLQKDLLIELMKSPQLEGGSNGLSKLNVGEVIGIVRRVQEKFEEDGPSEEDRLRNDKLLNKFCKLYKIAAGVPDRQSSQDDAKESSSPAPSLNHLQDLIDYEESGISGGLSGLSLTRHSSNVSDNSNVTLSTIASYADSVGDRIVVIK